MRCIRFILTVIILQSCTFIWAQSDASFYYKRGLDYYRNGKDQKAILDLEKAISMDSSYTQAWLAMGTIYEDLNQPKKAMLHLAQATIIDPNVTPKAYYALGRLNYDNNNLEASKHYLEIFLARTPENHALYAKGAKWYRDATFRLANKGQVKPFHPRNLGPSINTEMDEYLPAFTADGEYLIFTRRDRQEDFYITTMKDGAFVPAQPWETMNTNDNEGAHTISPDGNLIIFTYCGRGTIGSCDLMISERINGKWTEAKPLPQPINSPHWDSEPSISADGRLLFYASKRPTGLGGSDIYLAKRRLDGKWTKPTLLDSTINTTGDEFSPFFCADGKTLYFSSAGHPGFGGSDLFKTTYGATGWSTPINLGAPINNESNQGALAVNVAGDRAYYSSNGPLGNDTSSYYGGVDIYEFGLDKSIRPEPATYCKAIVVDGRSGRPLIAETQLSVLYNNDAKVRQVAKTNEQGELLFVLPNNAQYGIQITAPGYVLYSDHFSLDTITTNHAPFLLKIKLYKPEEIAETPAETASTASANKPIVLRNVFFETGSSDLLPVSRIELNTLVDMMNERPNIKIQIQGHTDNVGDTANNQQLSERRAAAVLEYLVQKGVDSSRLSSIGFGESRPVADNVTEAGRALNRRTAFVVLK